MSMQKLLKVGMVGVLLFAGVTASHSIQFGQDKGKTPAVFQGPLEGQWAQTEAPQPIRGVPVVSLSIILDKVKAGQRDAKEELFEYARTQLYSFDTINTWLHNLKAAPTPEQSEMLEELMPQTLESGKSAFEIEFDNFKNEFRKIHKKIADVYLQISQNSADDSASLIGSISVLMQLEEPISQIINQGVAYMCQIGGPIYRPIDPAAKPEPTLNCGEHKKTTATKPETGAGPPTR